MIHLDINFLDSLIRKLLLKLKNEHGASIVIDEGSYWQVPIEQLFELSQTPALHVGSIEDDINFLKQAFDEDIRTEFLEFERLSALFALLSKIYSYDRLKE
jgi:hypothetical protein